MKIKSAVFVKSSAEYQKCPPGDKPEYAFIGRSNVGKSSLINSLVDRNDLAKTSQQPGKTQLINHFLVNDEWYLVDLPGYGFAKVAKSEREKWQKMIDDYLLKRENLICTFVLIDSRIEAQKNDLEFMQKLGVAGLPFAIMFTKTDKLTKTKLAAHIEAYQSILLETWEDIPPLFITSALKKAGRDEILAKIAEWNGSFSIEK